MKSKKFFTLVTIPNRVEVDVVVVMAEEHQAQPRIERVNRNYEQNTNDPSLSRWVRVVPEMEINLERKIQDEISYSALLNELELENRVL